MGPRGLRERAERHWLAVVAGLALAGLLAVGLVGALTDAGASEVNGYGMLVFAIVTVPVVLWGTVWRQRQAAASRRQAETTHREALDARLRSGAEMVNSEREGVQLAGRYLLESLEAEYPDDYAELVERILIAAKVEMDDERPSDAG